MNKTPVGKRPSWHDYFKDITCLVAQRSVCLRRQVGALIVKDRKILTTGYNGPPIGVAHCSETGCMREELGIPSGERHELCRGLHAEQNAIIQAANSGVSIKGAEIYCTYSPCIICAKMLINAGIVAIHYMEGYPDEGAARMLEATGVNVVRLQEPVDENTVASSPDRPRPSSSSSKT